MKTTVISKEYLALQTDISNKQTEWANSLQKSDVIEAKAPEHKNIPIIAQTDVKINETQYKDWVIELAKLLVEKDENLSNDVKILKEMFDLETAKRWAAEALAFNQIYFQNFAKERELPEWLPYFLAEHSVRPFLRVASEVFNGELSQLESGGQCPCCGEPIRLAVLEGKGAKHLVCPRCEAKWQQRRLKCSFCGNEDHKKLSYYNVENDKSSQIEVCEECNGYIKIIDTRKLFKKQTAFLLDVNSIHLDIIAQEKGFGVTTEDIKS